MRRILRGSSGRIEELARLEPGSWVHVVEPDDGDLGMLRSLGIPGDLLAHASDLDERPRVHHENGVLLVVVNYPFRQRPSAAVPFVTSPLTVFVAGPVIVTVSPRAVEFIEPLAAGTVAGLDTSQPTGFILTLLWQLADEYLDCVREINASVDRLEDSLRQSLRNEEVIGLLDCQKSLTYFATAMRANELVLDRLQRPAMLSWSDADRDLLEDVLIEVRQAIEMADISENILSQMMDAFASIVSNNLNSVMKVLTSVTIVLAIPTLVASLYGMNLRLPGADRPLAFAGIVVLCLALCGALVLLFRRRNWL